MVKATPPTTAATNTIAHGSGIKSTQTKATKTMKIPKASELQLQVRQPRAPAQHSLPSGCAGSGAGPPTPAIRTNPRAPRSTATSRICAPSARGVPPPSRAPKVEPLHGRDQGRVHLAG